MLFSTLERAFAEAVRRLAYTNPFDNDAQAAVRQELAGIDLGLGEDERKRPAVDAPLDPFADAFARRIEALLERIRPRLRLGRTDVNRSDQELYEDLVIAALTLRYLAPFDPLRAGDDGTERLPIYIPFRDGLRYWTDVPLRFSDFFARPEQAFAVVFQYRLAIVLLKRLIRGESRPVARLRADVWHSIFPRELRLYGVLLFERMHEVTTLILGPSGTGKELVATAIGQARFVPFDPRRERFVEPFAGAFHPVNLSAMPRDLIEAEMFGHVAGAFTGATKDRVGWFEKCARGHTVFLDELGELDESVQVRLLRVLQNREFQRVGDTEPRRFEGRVIAATNRDLAARIDTGHFREDLYFRLCSDVIRTPTLRAQLDDAPGELPELIRLVAARCLGEKADPEFVDGLSRSTLAWIERAPEMGPGYAWPGNFRELEQCVRSVMVRGEYNPPQRRAPPPEPGRPVAPPPVPGRPVAPPDSAAAPLERFLAEIRAGSLTFDELLVRYCSLIRARAGNIAETARRLGKHRLTVQGRIEPAWVERFRGG